MILAEVPGGGGTWLQPSASDVFYTLCPQGLSTAPAPAGQPDLTLSAQAGPVTDRGRPRVTDYGLLVGGKHPAFRLLLCALWVSPADTP